MTLLLGIDLGTSYFKVGLFDAAGEMKGLGRVPVIKDTPALGHCELPLDEFWSALRRGLAEALVQARATADQICGMSYSSQASTFVMLDRHAAPLTPLVLWTDTRAEPTEEAKAFAAQAAFQPTVGFEGFSKFSAVTKWQWFKQSRPELWSEAAYVMTISDYFTYALTGDRVGDASTAAFLGIYDLHRRDWWPDALRAFGVSRDQFSRPLLPGQQAGQTTAQAAALLGLPAGIPFAVGALDHHAAAIGSGLGVLADLSISTGTVLAAILLVDTVEPVSSCYHGPHVDGKTFFRLAFDPDGAGRLEEFQREYGEGRSIEELLELAANAPGGERPPPLSTRRLGERETGAAVRAILERVSATHLRLVERVAAGRAVRAVVATGGGARSPLWLQITADTLNVPVVTPTCLERACLGAAAFASVAAGMHSSLGAALGAMVHPGRSFEPQRSTPSRINDSNMMTNEQKMACAAVTGIIVAVGGGGCTAGTSQVAGSTAMSDRAHGALLEVMDRDEKFIKVHAAELLIARGEKERVRGVFLRELERHGDVPGYRVGIWRVLAGAAANETERAQWIGRITAAFMDRKGADRIHAIESLGKLGQRVEGDVRRAAEEMAGVAGSGEGLYAWWVLHLSGNARAMDVITTMLASPEAVGRLRAAYIVRWEGIRNARTLSALATAADGEKKGEIGYGIILAAAFALDANPARAAAWRAAIDDILETGSAGDRYQVCLSMREKFSATDLPRLTRLLEHENGDVRVGAAAAILAVVERGTSAR